MISRKLFSRILPLVSAGVAGLAMAGENPEAKPIGKFTLIYNVNNNGYVDVCGCKHKKVRQGSLVRRASYLKQLRSTGREPLLLDGGGTLFAAAERLKGPEREEAIRKAALIVEAYNRMGYRAMAVGVADLAMGLDTLKQLTAAAKFDVLAANCFHKESKKPVFKPFEIYNAGGVRVGVFGLLLETMGKYYLEEVAPNMQVTDPLTAARQAVEAMRGKTDLIVALSHLKQESNYELIHALKEVAAVVDPYIQYQNTHSWIKEEEWLGVLDDTLFLRGDGQGARLGLLDITVTRSGAKLKPADRQAEIEAALNNGKATEEDRAELAAFKNHNLFQFERVSIEPHHKEDPDLNNLVAEWKKGIDPSKVARFEAALPRKDQFLTAEGCKGCHETVFEFWRQTGHAHALESLQKTSDEHRYDCIGCHSLGYGEAFLDTSRIGNFANVQCESCHGLSPEHAKDPKRFHFKPIQEDTCLVCHNKEQTLKDLEFFTMRKKIQCPKETN
ncbi:MAG: hypothetical protein HY717_06685 [Planctomycetes bacterium]|nr:hypothetical protein [Planctomycetota bacterium]